MFEKRLSFACEDRASFLDASQAECLDLTNGLGISAVTRAVVENHVGDGLAGGQLVVETASCFSYSGPVNAERCLKLMRPCAASRRLQSGGHSSSGLDRTVLQREGRVSPLADAASEARA